MILWVIAQEPLKASMGSCADLASPFYKI